MGTRSRIAIQNADGTLESIYCHWDGYPSNNGVILQKHYQDESKVRELIALGDLSILAPNTTPEGSHSFDKPEDGVCVVYGRDRKETGVESRKSHNLPELLELTDSSWGEWLYIFSPEKLIWEVVDLHSSSKQAQPLTEVLEGVTE